MRVDSPLFPGLRLSCRVRGLAQAKAAAVRCSCPPATTSHPRSLCSDSTVGFSLQRRRETLSLPILSFSRCQHPRVFAKTCTHQDGAQHARPSSRFSCTGCGFYREKWHLQFICVGCRSPLASREREAGERNQPLLAAKDALRPASVVRVIGSEWKARSDSRLTHLRAVCL